MIKQKKQLKLQWLIYKWMKCDKWSLKINIYQNKNLVFII